MAIIIYVLLIHIINVCDCLRGKQAHFEKKISLVAQGGFDVYLI